MIKRRRLVILSGLVGLGAVAMVPWSVAERSIERFLLTRLSAQFSLSGITASSGAVAVLPVPRIVANDVAFTAADGSVAARIPRIRADLRLLPLLGGRIEFDRLVLRAPQIDIRVDAEPVDPLAVVLSTKLAELPALPNITITDNGAIFLRRGAGIISVIRDIDGNIMAHAKGEAVQASGRLVWRGERLDFAFASNSPARSILPTLRIRSEVVSVDFSAARATRASAAAKPTLDGQLQISAPSMSRLGSWLASGSAVTLPLGSTTVSGRLALSDEGAQLSTASLTLGSDVLDGALDWRKRNNRWLLSGTMAGKNLDIGRPQAGIDVARIALPELAGTALIDLDDIFAHDIDLRMSVQRVRLPGLVLTDVATQVMATDQRLDLAMSNAGLYGGVLRGRGSISRADNGVALRTQMTAERVDLGQLSADLFDGRRITGVGAFQQTLEANGRTPTELATAATGRFSFSARNGEFAGTNLSDAMRRIERQPLSVARDWRGGRTGFEQIALTGIVADGMIEISEARGHGPSYRMAMDGQVSLLERLFRLKGSVQSTNGAATIPFDIVGPVNDPTVQVNARAFLERSGAAAPLLLPRAN